MDLIHCPICGNLCKESNINRHIDSSCNSYIHDPDSVQSSTPDSSQKQGKVASFFSNSSSKSQNQSKSHVSAHKEETAVSAFGATSSKNRAPATGTKRPFGDGEEKNNDGLGQQEANNLPKRVKGQSNLEKVAPLAERMRPKRLDEVYGQDLVGPGGVLRELIENNNVPSMILWGSAGTGKTTIARVIATAVGCRFVEINSTSSGVAECKKLFAEAKNELSLTGRKTILFCDEIHRFSKSQQDVFLGPVESGQITLIGATTENPSFKVQNALLSRCRTFTLAKLTDEHIGHILERAFDQEKNNYAPSSVIDHELISYLAAFADGDARTALNLLEMAMGLSTRRNITKEEIKKSLTKTLVYDRAGDQHYDTISAFHKSIRGGDADAALYYLARMIQSGEDALYIARRLIVVASEDVGLADNSMLSLATAAYTAAEKIGMPEARINLAHATVALALSKKSTRAYRGLAAAQAVLNEPGIAGLPIPVHLRNAPTRLMKELGYGKEYKYNPNYRNGEVVQEYLPEALQGKTFLEDLDLGTEIDPELRNGHRFNPR